MDAISCLAPHAALQYPLHPMSGGAFTDAAFARALHFSMAADSLSSGASSSTSSYTLADFAGYSAGGGGFFAGASAPSSSALLPPPPQPQQPAITSESVVVADASARRRASPGARRQLGPAGAARAGKRRSRASKRAPTTYICADPANFRLMVQQVTGVEADPDSLLQADGVAVLPTATTGFDAATSLHHMLEYTGAFGEKNLDPFGMQAAAQQQQPCFPTLDSWSVMYESNQLL